MRFVSRGTDPPPEGLSAKDKKGKTELERAIENFAKPVPEPFEFKAYKDDEVRERLEALFHGKCAYCESEYSSTAPVDIEHFRPKGAIEGEPNHHGYWWLAMNWENLLPSCIDCNRKRKQITPTPGTALATLFERQRQNASAMVTGKKDAFPITAAHHANWEKPVPGGSAPALDGEGALLLNPAIDHPEEHLVFHVDDATLISLVLPNQAGGAGSTQANLPLAGKGIGAAAVAANAATRQLSVRGAVSIQVYGLNRLGLVQARSRLLRRLEFLSDIAIDLLKLADEQRARTGDADPVAKKLDHLATRILDEITGLARPQEPYSAVAQAWLKQFKAQFKAKRRPKRRTIVPPA